MPVAHGTDNGKEFCRQSMLTWVYARRVQHFLIVPGLEVLKHLKKTQNWHQALRRVGRIQGRRSRFSLFAS